MDSKVCAKCKIEKPLDGFNKEKRHKDGLESSCNACKRVSNQKYYAEAGRHRHLEKKYGLNPKEVDMLYEVHSHSCSACGISEANLAGTKHPRLVIDHDHSTGEIRGLLCNHCNICLGMARDDVKILQSLIDYLEGK